MREVDGKEKQGWIVSVVSACVSVITVKIGIF
jgi:hypothetical protein